ncbi:hypothetical protein Pelo_18332 [Pelomyxa schiedti]|nr:hypothetical protein Pelo_18332 [Pelomyxa schiedti]
MAAIFFWPRPYVMATWSLQNGYTASLGSVEGSLQRVQKLHVREPWNDDFWLRMLISSIKRGHSSADVIRIINKCPTEGDALLISELIVTAMEYSRRDILEHLLERIVHWEDSVKPKWITLMCEKKWYDLLLVVLSRMQLRDPDSLRLLANSSL